MHFFFTPIAKNRLSLLAVLASIALLVGLALWDSQPPTPSATPVTAKEFSLPQAQQQLAQISRERHPIGSAAHDVVRDYLLNELKALGLQPEVQTTFVVVDKGESSGQVQNIVVRLPGKNSGKKTLLLAAHYDSAAFSFGAGDDGVSVVSILQTLKALKSRAPLENDVIVLISDGEETGLLGASGFAESHPWFKEVGMVLNFDNRGNAGPVLMFETSLGNGKLIAGFADAVKSPVSNSMMYEVYKAMPQDTDFVVFRGKSIPGLNFGIIQNVSSYHTSYDRADLISPATQQQQGEMMLKLAQHFGNQDLTQLAGENRVYFNFPGLGLLHYSETLALPLAGVIAALALLAFWRERKSSALRVKAIAGAAVLFMLSAAVFAFLAQQIWNGVFRFVPDYLRMPDCDPSHLYLLAILLLTLTGFFAIQKFFLRWLSAREIAFGAATVWLLLLIYASWEFPGASFLFAWPLFFVLLSWLALNFVRTEQVETYTPWLLLAGGTFAIVLFTPLLLLFNIALTFHSLGVPVLLFVLLLGIISPLIFWIFERLRARVFVLASALLIVGAALATHNFHQSFPLPSHVRYVAVPEKQQFYWLTAQKELDRVGLPMFSPQSVHKTLPEVYGTDSPAAKWKYWVDKAPDANIAAPLITLKSDQIQGETREIILHISSPARASSTAIEIEGVSVLNSSMQGLSNNSKIGENWNTLVHALPAAGVELRFQVAKNQSKPMNIRVTDQFFMPAAIGEKLAMAPASNISFRAQVISMLEIH